MKIPSPSKNLTRCRQRDKLSPPFTATFEEVEQALNPTDQNDALRSYCKGVIRALIAEREQNHGKSLGLLPAVNR